MRAITALTPGSEWLRKRVHWGCPKCQHSMTGFLLPGESAERVCPSHTAIVKGKRIPGARVQKNGMIVPYVCKTPMIVLEDERNCLPERNHENIFG
jgi:hypothetical protein